MLRTILAPNPSAMTLDGTRTFVVGIGNPVIIDPGPDDPAHEAAIVAALGGAVPAAILLTHGHPDHAALAPALSARTGAPILAWPELAQAPVPETGAGRLRAIHTPGHTADHVSFLWEPPGAPAAMFVGDAFMGGQDTVLIASPEGDLAAYLDTLGRVEELAPAVLYPAHGPLITDGAAAAARYRAHRMERVEQVMEALRRQGPARALDLVDGIYGRSLPPELRLAAAGSIQAVLDHLHAAGQLRLHPDGRADLL